MMHGIEKPIIRPDYWTRMVLSPEQHPKNMEKLNSHVRLTQITPRISLTERCRHKASVIPELLYLYSLLPLCLLNREDILQFFSFQLNSHRTRTFHLLFPPPCRPKLGSQRSTYTHVNFSRVLSSTTNKSKATYTCL
jgi:hypothetical protein